MNRRIGWSFWLVAGCAVEPASDGSDVADPQLEGGQYGESEDGECEIVGRTPIALDDPTPLGFTAQSIADWVVGTRDVVVSWEAGGSTPGVLDVQLGSVFELLELDSAEPGYTTSGCLDALGIGLHVVFSSDDGAFDEQFDDAVVARVPEAAGMSHPFASLAGTFDPLALAGSEYSAVEARLEIAWSPAGIADGEIDGSGTLASSPAGLRSLQFATITDAP